MNSQSENLSVLNGTDTQQNLLRAFEIEAQNHTKNMLFSRLAELDGNFSAANAMKEQADNDLHHAELWLSYLDGMGSTRENLSVMSSSKNAQNEAEYPKMAQTADAEGLSEIAEKMRLAANVKMRQANILDSELSRLDTLPESDDSNALWRCRCCGYVLQGNTPPEHCPLCSYPACYFARVCEA